MNASLQKALVSLGSVIGTALLGAFSLFLSRVLEPLIAWFSFTSMKLLIKWTKSPTLRSMYGDLKKGYDETKSKE